MWEDKNACCPARRPSAHCRANSNSQVPRLKRLIFGLIVLCVFGAVSKVRAQSTGESDSYKAQIQGVWVYATPTGKLQGSADTDFGSIDLTKDLHFQTYSTCFGKLEWTFTHKNHIYVYGTRLRSSQETVLNRTFTFQGKTFDAGLTVQSSLDSPAYDFGYQCDIIRRRRGHLGIGFQVNVFDTSASIKAAAQVTGDGVHHAAVSASATQLAPIPVGGPEFRY